ncbi:MAG: hypothetical protein A2161_15670 [Candidatus Schekmanbacteria bacterium RBG_13_48_7]|uniref:Uncharacterized protein n=1 Tax=Candidatus Schekmanbacteria bacterium RBG_13_48_7 TaxID=1817878 RepID=A0A1F7S092_9BACT|nr:MAG: hypothetical protein A2161_15670 [Candidatus Schekmanbacteria bacterium RBG_13_48_7]
MVTKNNKDSYKSNNSSIKSLIITKDLKEIKPILNYWLITIPIWAAWGFLIIVVAGDNYRFLSGPPISLPNTVLWIFASGIFINPLFHIIKTDYSEIFLKKEPVILIFLPVLFIISYLTQNPLELCYFTLFICIIYLYIRCVILFSIILPVNSQRGINSKNVGLGFILFFQLGFSFVPILQGMNNSYTYLISLISAILCFYLLYIFHISSSPERKTVQIVAICFISLPVISTIAHSEAYKEWIGCFLVCSAFLLLFRSDTLFKGSNTKWKTVLAFFPFVLSLFISLRHLPLIFLLILVLIIPQSRIKRKIKSHWLIYTVAGLTLLLWVFLGNISDYFKISCSVLFGIDGFYLSGSIWLLGLVGIWFSHNTWKSLIEIIFLNVLFFTACYAVSKYPTQLPIMYFLPFLIVSGMFIRIIPGDKNSPVLELFENIIGLITIIISSLYAASRFFNLTIYGKTFFGFQRHDLVIRFVQNLIFQNSGLFQPSLLIGTTILILVIFIVLVSYKRFYSPVVTGVRNTNTIFIYKPFFFLPLILFLVLSIFLFFFQDTPHNIITKPVLIDSREPCIKVYLTTIKDIKHLAMISYASHSVSCSQGTLLAEMCLEKNGKNLESYPIRAGEETAEWAAERPDIIKQIKHKPAVLWNQYLEIYDDTFYPRNIYIWEKNLDKPESPDMISVCINKNESEKNGFNLTIESLKVW